MGFFYTVEQVEESDVFKKFKEEISKDDVDITISEQKNPKKDNKTTESTEMQ